MAVVGEIDASSSIELDLAIAKSVGEGATKRKKRCLYRRRTKVTKTTKIWITTMTLRRRKLNLKVVISRIAVAAFLEEEQLHQSY